MRFKNLARVTQLVRGGLGTQIRACAAAVTAASSALQSWSRSSSLKVGGAVPGWMVKNSVLRQVKSAPWRQSRVGGGWWAPKPGSWLPRLALGRVVSQGLGWALLSSSLLRKVT